MKKALALAILTGFGTSVLAQQTVPSAPGPLSDQQEYACKVLLCLANPKGPEAVSDCRPPIERLKRDMARGKRFPVCDLASGPNGQSYATPGSSLYDACPQGTVAAAPGQAVMLAGAMPAAAIPAAYRSGGATTYSQGSIDLGYIGIGDGSASQWAGGGDAGNGTAPPAKVCVAGFRGTTTMGNGDSSYQVSMYDTVFVQQPQTSQFIDVYIDNAIWQRVRW